MGVLPSCLLLPFQGWAEEGHRAQVAVAAAFRKERGCQRRAATAGVPWSRCTPVQGAGTSPDRKSAPIGQGGGGASLVNSWLGGFLGGDTKSGMVAGAALSFFQLRHLNWSWANFISKFVLPNAFIQAITLGVFPGGLGSLLTWLQSS